MRTFMRPVFYPGYSYKILLYIICLGLKHVFEDISSYRISTSYIKWR